MTEKRFIIAICSDGKLGIRDLITLNEYTSERQVADYMNRITDKNEQLKTQLSEQGTQIDFLKDENKHMRKVLEENKELKQTLEQIQDSLWTAEHIKKLEKENGQLRFQLNICSDQRNEFHRGARENANRVGKLKKENKQLKNQNELLSDELEQCRAVIDKRWSEYLKQKELRE